MSYLYFVFGKRGGYDAHQITPVNNVVFVLCIWKGGYSLKQKLIPANNVAFVLCNWEQRGDYDMHQITPVNIGAFVLCIWKGRLI